MGWPVSADGFDDDGDPDAELPALWVTEGQSFYASTIYHDESISGILAEDDDEDDPDGVEPDVVINIIVNNIPDGVLDPTNVMTIISVAAAMVHKEFWPQSENPLDMEESDG